MADQAQKDLQRFVPATRTCQDLAHQEDESFFLFCLIGIVCERRGAPHDNLINAVARRCHMIIQASEYGPFSNVIRVDHTWITLIHGGSKILIAVWEIRGSL